MNNKRKMKKKKRNKWHMDSMQKGRADVIRDIGERRFRWARTVQAAVYSFLAYKERAGPGLICCNLCSFH
jgi:hypothetical protein